MLLAGLCALSLVGAACGSGDSGEDEATTTAETGGAESDDTTDDETSGALAGDVWVGELDGSPTTVEIGVSASEAPELAAVEAYREAIGEAPLTYVRVTVEGDSVQNPPAYGDINGGDGLDPDLVVDFVCAYVATFWDIPADLDDEGLTAAFDLQLAASEAVGCGDGRLLPAGSGYVYFLALSESQPAIETLSIRFNDFTPQ